MTDNKLEQLNIVSDINRVLNNAKQYFNDSNIILAISTRKNKKYMIMRPDKSWVHFGDIRYEDFTKHNDPTRRNLYLHRSENIKGDWKDDKYSPNNISRALLWEEFN
jgi:hypothetical protein